MVVLSIAVGTKGGKLLLCRDFSDISRTLVEDCINSLPQLIKENQEHTFVEHNNLRLNYLPLGGFFLLSINDKASNILEDIEVLRSVQSAMHTILAHGISEESICAKAIDIIFTLDDIISLGHRNISSDSLLANALEMESANERLILLQKEQQEKEAKKKAQEFIRQEKKKKMFSPSTSETFSPPADESKQHSFNLPDRLDEAENDTRKTSTVENKKTLKLGTQKKKEKIRESNEEANAGPTGSQLSTTTRKTEASEESAVFNPLDASVKFKVNETIILQMDTEGKLRQFQLKGDISFTIQDPKITKIAVLVESEKKTQLAPKIPPSFNKKMWTEDLVLVPRDEKTSFQPKMSTPAIKYGFDSSKGDLSPLNLSIWLSENSVAIECEFNGVQSWLKSLSNVKVTIPAAGTKPRVVDNVNSDYEFDSKTQDIVWTIPKLGAVGDSDASLNIEFDGKFSEESIFPWRVNFTPSKPYGDFLIANVKNLDNDEDLKFESSYEIKVEMQVTTSD